MSVAILQAGHMLLAAFALRALNPIEQEHAEHIPSSSARWIAHLTHLAISSLSRGLCCRLQRQSNHAQPSGATYISPGIRSRPVQMKRTRRFGRGVERVKRERERERTWDNIMVSLVHLSRALACS